MCPPSHAERLRRVREEIARTSALHRRAPDSVRLVAVSKQQPSDKVVALARLGQRDFAENYAQEAVAKIEQVMESLAYTDDIDTILNLRWHFIGHIQSRKCRAIAEHFNWVHSVDRIKVASALSRWRAGAVPLNVLIQLNLQEEDSKHGVSERELPVLADAVAKLPNLVLRGLMVIPKPEKSPQKQRAVFRRCHAALDALNARGLRLDHLSMGMTADMESAIAEGASMVRVGTGVFGPRPASRHRQPAPANPFHLQSPASMNKPTKIAFIGGGNMARGIIGGLINSGWAAGDLSVADPVGAQREGLAERFGVACFEDNARCAERGDVVVLAVKPQLMRPAVESVAETLQRRSAKPLLISVAAGIRCDDVLRWAGGALALVRVMPNTPALVNAGISGLFANDLVTAQQRALAQTILRAVGETVWVEREALIDTVTGVSGSGPAYFFKLMELLARGAQDNGLDRETANALAVQTALGAALLAQQSEADAATLRRQVTSAGGTTEAALSQMEALGLDDAILQGIAAAIARAEQLADEFGDKFGDVR